MFQQKGFMLILTFISSASLGFSATIPLTQPISSSPIEPLSANITTVGAYINSRFTIISGFLDIPIDENDCLMNVIIAMGRLSARTFTRPTYGDPRYPSVRILARGPPGGGPIEARYLLWGFYFGIRSMLQGNDWRLAEFTLLWDGVTVGFLSFGKLGAQSSLQGSNSTGLLTPRSTDSSDPSAYLSHINNTQTASPNQMFYIDVDPASFGASLPKINIFMAVLECFLYLAAKTSGEILLAFSVTPFPYDVALRLEPIFRREEPFFDNGVAGLGLATVPSKMISERHQQWTEMGFNYKVDDVLIGMGEIVRGRR